MASSPEESTEADDAGESYGLAVAGAIDEQTLRCLIGPEADVVGEECKVVRRAIKDREKESKPPKTDLGGKETETES